MPLHVRFLVAFLMTLVPAAAGASLRSRLPASRTARAHAGQQAKPRRPLDADLPASIRRLHPGLVERIELAVAHFRKTGGSAQMAVLPYRTQGEGNHHSRGQALDFRLVGVDNSALVAFCKTLPDTGCGYFPNAPFIHMDVREPGTGNVAWTDLARPGEPPRYLKAPEPRLPALPAERATAADEDPKPEAAGQTSRAL